MSGFSPIAGWGEPIATWTSDGSDASAVFTNLGGYRELLVWGDGILFGGNSSAPALRFSDDNGATFYNTNYENADSSTGGFTLSTNVTTAHGFRITILDFNTSRKPKVTSDGVRIGVANNPRWGTRAAGPYNAIQIISDSFDMSAGTITVFGRS